MDEARDYAVRFAELFSKIKAVAKEKKLLLLREDMIAVALKLLEEENHDRRGEAASRERQRITDKKENNKATEKQKALMQKLKIPFAKETTIEEASKLIDAKIGKKK